MSSLSFSFLLFKVKKKKKKFGNLSSCPFLLPSKSRTDYYYDCSGNSLNQGMAYWFYSFPPLGLQIKFSSSQQ